MDNFHQAQHFFELIDLKKYYTIMRNFLDPITRINSKTISNY